MDNRIARTIGENIAARAREYQIANGKRKLHVIDIAQKMHVTPKTIRKWMSGEREPKAYALYRLSKLFGCTMEDLCAGLEEMQ